MHHDDHRPDSDGTLILSRGDVADLLALDDCITAVEAALGAHAEGRTIAPAVVGSYVEAGGFHLKTAGLVDAHRFAAKLNSNFYDNAERYGLPRIQGLIVVFDTRNGYPLAVLDSGLITELRTGAASAVAAKYLAREDATTATICGCGLQGRVHLLALARVLSLERAYVVDLDGSAAERFADELGAELGLEVRQTHDLAHALARSQIVATCTPSREPFLRTADVAPGTFIAAAGADSEVKQELDSELLGVATVVLDSVDSCSRIGELHHALEAGVLASAEGLAELHEIVAGRRAGRRHEDEIVVYDSTGVALQDVAAAAIVLERARSAGAGHSMRILSP